MGIKLDMFHNETEGETFDAGQAIFREHDHGWAMYVILQGEVELSINGEVIETLGPGEPFGEMALIDQSPRVATAIAKTPCKAVAIPEKRFLFMIQQTPYFALQIMKVMAERLRKMNTKRTR